MRPIGIIKVGTSNTGLFAASDFSAPMVRQGRLIDLQDASTWNTLTQTLTDYTEILKDLKVDYGLVSGGEIIRQNHTLRHRIRELGLPLWTVSSVLEGWLTWFAVKSEFPEVSAIIDVGGGSTEVVTGNRVWAIPAGAAQVSDPGTWPRIDSVGPTMALVGGTAYGLEQMAGQGRISGAQLIELLAAVLSPFPPPAFWDLDAPRRLLVVGGSEVLRSLLSGLDSTQFIFAHRGFVEGLWLAASLGRARLL